ncbi:MAG: hypothetical protein AB3N64_00260 [Puniceicoccaceae bacterium]
MESVKEPVAARPPRPWAFLGGRILIYALILASVFTAAGIFMEYGYYDDFWQLYFYQHGKFEAPTSLFYQCGRPVQDLLSRPLFTGIDSISGLAWIRALNLLVFIAFAGLLIYLFESLGRFRKASLPLALIATLTPATGIILAWATMVHAPVSLLLSLIAGTGTLRVLESRQMATTSKLGWLLLFLVMTLLAEMSYQPSAGAFLLPFIIHLARSGNEREVTLLALKGVLFFLLVLVLYYIIYKISVLLWVGEGWFTARAEPGANLVGQLLFYLTHILSLAASYWEVFRTALPASGFEVILDRLANPALTIAVLGLCVYTWLHPVRSNPRDPCRWLGAALGPCFIGLILAPAILSSEQYFNFRLFSVLYIALVIWSATGLGHLWKRFLQNHSGSPTVVFAWILAAYFGLQSWTHVRHDLIEPVRQEYSILTDAVLGTYEEYPTSMVYVAPAEEYATLSLKKSRISDYGIPLATLPYGPQHLIKLVLNKHLTGKLAHPRSEKVEALFIEPGRFIASDWVRPLRADLLFADSISPPIEPESRMTPDPVFGQVMSLSDDWIFSRKFGYLNLSEYPHLLHLNFGWMYYYPEFGYIEFQHPNHGKLNSMLKDFHYWQDESGNYYTLEAEKGVVHFRPFNTGGS